MRNNIRCHRDCVAERCSICGRPFGLIRHYSWRTPLCSKTCVERFKARQKMDRSWLFWIAPADGARSSPASH
jgi:hypothetical protein